MKQTLRKKYLQLRKQLQDKENKSKIIVNQILESKDYQQASIIALYYALPDEVQTLSLIKQALVDHKHVYLPKVISSNKMLFYKIQSLDDLVKGSFDIYEPQESNSSDSVEFDLMIVPGICFDKQGNRIGFGKGYYDRYLKNHSFKTIGLCFKEQIVNHIEVDENDIQLDEIITD